MGLLKTTRFVDRPVRVSIHKALNSSRGVIRCHELSGMTEMEIRTELQEQGVVEVHKVTVKKDTEKVLTNTLFLTFNTPDLLKEITVGYLKVKVALFVPNPMRCFNCNKFGHTSQRCKVAAKCPGCGKDKHECLCEGPKLCSFYPQQKRAYSALHPQAWTCIYIQAMPVGTYRVQSPGFPKIVY